MLGYHWTPLGRHEEGTGPLVAAAADSAVVVVVVVVTARASP